MTQPCWLYYREGRRPVRRPTCPKAVDLSEGRPVRRPTCPKAVDLSEGRPVRRPSTCPKADLSEGRRPVRRPTCPKAVDLSEGRPVRRPSTCPKADLSEGRRPVPRPSTSPEAVVPFTCPEAVVSPPWRLSLPFSSPSIDMGCPPSVDAGSFAVSVAVGSSGTAMHHPASSKSERTQPLCCIPVRRSSCLQTRISCRLPSLRPSCHLPVRRPSFLLRGRRPPCLLRGSWAF